MKTCILCLHPISSRYNRPWDTVWCLEALIKEEIGKEASNFSFIKRVCTECLHKIDGGYYLIRVHSSKSIWYDRDLSYQGNLIKLMKASLEHRAKLLRDHPTLKALRPCNVKCTPRIRLPSLQTKASTRLLFNQIPEGAGYERMEAQGKPQSPATKTPRRSL